MKKNIITSKISLKLLLTMVICLTVSILIPIYTAGSLLNYYIFNLKEDINVNIFNFFSYSMFIIGITVFITSFLLIVGRKIKYIKYIAERVKNISGGDLGSILKIQGSDEIADLCVSINSMSLELKERFDKEKQMEDAKNELITNVSHDLRTPLTSIIGYVDLLKRKEYKSEAQLNEYIDTIYCKSQNLQVLINELFEYTKLTTPGIKINFSNIDLGGLLEQMVGEYIPIFSDVGLTIKKDIPQQDVIVNVDIEKIVRVFENILMNAKKYSSKPSEIYLKLVKQNDKAIVSISNKTDKISVKNLDMLFDKFYRADISRKDSDGAGFGLAIAKRIVELHGGRIWAEYDEAMITFNIEIGV